MAVWRSPRHSEDLAASVLPGASLLLAGTLGLLKTDCRARVSVCCCCVANSIVFAAWRLPSPTVAARRKHEKRALGKTWNERPASLFLLATTLAIPSTSKMKIDCRSKRCKPQGVLKRCKSG